MEWSLLEQLMYSHYEVAVKELSRKPNVVQRSFAHDLLISVSCHI